MICCYTSQKAGGLEPVTAICLPKHSHKAVVLLETLENMICRPQVRENACILHEPGHSEIRRWMIEGEDAGGTRP